MIPLVHLHRPSVSAVAASGLARGLNQSERFRSRDQASVAKRDVQGYSDEAASLIAEEQDTRETYAQPLLLSTYEILSLRQARPQASAQQSPRLDYEVMQDADFDSSLGYLFDMHA